MSGHSLNRLAVILKQLEDEEESKSRQVRIVVKRDPYFFSRPASLRDNAESPARFKDAYKGDDDGK